MKTTLASRVALFCALLVAPLSAKADLINVNLSPAGTNVAGVDGTAGQTWNSFNADGRDAMGQYDYLYDFTTGYLSDAGGTPTSAYITFSGDGSNHQNFDNAETFDPTLFGYEMGSSNQSIDVSGLAAGNYDLIVYSSNEGDHPGTGNMLTFDANGVAETLLNAQNNSGFSTDPGNYLSVDVTVGSNGELNLTDIDTYSIGMSGLQIEALPPSVPEPSVLSMAIGGGLLLVFFMRRKSAAQS